VDRGVFLLPKEMSYEEGVFIEPLACVIRGLRTAGMKPRHTVLIIGSGISGLLFVKLARAWGAGRVFTTDIDAYRLKMAKKCGADVVIHAKEDIPEEVKKHNEGRLADLVVICAGASEAVQQGLRSVEPGGTILFFAPTKHDVNVPFPLFELWNKQDTMVSTYAGSPKDILQAIDCLVKKKVEVLDMITHMLPLRKAAKGFELVAQAQVSMKVIIQPQKK
jgi:L-iditol 2-dehydrogenase